jgi:hypothetical protein
MAGGTQNKIGPNRGNAGRGRPKGSLNKTTVAAKDAIAQAFDRVGGVNALVDWIEKSDDNRKIFYSTIHPKLIPVQVSGEGGGSISLIVTTGVPRDGADS